ncbi:MAG: MFS transporter [Candidatus Lokiarchaeota archaeon]|nr:MFS transporter [Candidatus Lokiarchaeota archaeon]
MSNLNLGLEKPKKISKRNIAALFLISFGGNIAWAIENQYYNVYLYNRILPDPFYVSLMVAITAIVSTVTTIVMGSIMDIRGKRRSFIIWAFILWAFASAAFPLAEFVKPINVFLAVGTAIFIDCVMSFFGATAYDAGYNAFIIDITTVENRAKAVSINEIMTLFGTLVVYGITGFLLDAGLSYFYYFLIMAAATGIIGVVGGISMKDSPTLQPLKVGLWDHIRSTFNRQNIRENTDCFLVLSGIAIQATSFSIFFPFIVIYLEHEIQLTGLWPSLVMFLGLFTSVVLSIPVGIFVDKIGRKRVAIISIVLESLSLVAFAYSRELIWLIITGILWVFFMMTWHISSQAWAGDLYPKTKAGQFNGYFLIVNVLIAMVVGSPIGGLLSRRYGTPVVVDGIPGFAPSYLIYLVGAGVVIFAIIPLLFAKEKPKPENVVIQ